MNYRKKTLFRLEKLAQIPGMTGGFGVSPMAKEVLIMSIFTPESAQQDAEKIKTSINAPVVSARVSQLGGSEHTTIMITISLDPRETWENGIAENSRLMRFSLNMDGKLEQFTLLEIPLKFRKSRVKSIDDAISKINNYISFIGETKAAKMNYREKIIKTAAEMCKTKR